jgi:hypothetical protein
VADGPGTDMNVKVHTTSCTRETYMGRDKAYLPSRPDRTLVAQSVQCDTSP